MLKENTTLKLLDISDYIESMYKKSKFESMKGVRKKKNKRNIQRSKVSNDGNWLQDEKGLSKIFIALF